MTKINTIVRQQASYIKLASYNSNKFVIGTERKLYVRYCKTHSSLSYNFSLKDNSNYLKNKIDDLVAKYEQITGMDEVRKAQNRVIEAQDKFVFAQEKRREIVKELTIIQNKLKELYAELDTTTRGEER